MSAQPPVLEIRNLSKSYGSVQALTEVDFEVRAGEVMALVGDFAPARVHTTIAARSLLAGVCSHACLATLPTPLDACFVPDLCIG